MDRVTDQQLNEGEALDAEVDEAHVEHVIACHDIASYYRTLAKIVRTLVPALIREIREAKHREDEVRRRFEKHGEQEKMVDAKGALNADLGVMRLFAERDTFCAALTSPTGEGFASWQRCDTCNRYWPTVSVMSYVTCPSCIRDQLADLKTVAQEAYAIEAQLSMSGDYALRVVTQRDWKALREALKKVAKHIHE